MTDTADFLASKETQDVPSYDVSFSPAPEPPAPSPLPNYFEEQQPPPYSATPEMYPSPKTGSTGTDQPESCDVDPEAPTDITEPAVPSPFDDDIVRRAFIRKVFAILTVQLLFTFSVVCVFTFSTVVKEAVQEHFWAYISSFLIFLVVAGILSCCKSFSRRHPWNLVGLFVVTLSMSYMVGTVASFHDTAAVVIAMGSTLTISIAVIAFSAQARYEFNICSGFLLVLVLDMLMFGFFSIFFYSNMAHVAYGFLGALLFSLFLMIDCLLIMDRVNPEEYVSAALMLYLDIMLIFIYLMGRRN